MKTISKFLAVIIVMIIPFAVNAQEKSKANETVKFKTSIDCAACVNTIMTNLPQEKGIRDVKCDLATKEVTVTYQKEKNNPEEIKKSIEKLGYTAKVIPAENSQKK
ncbi:MAG: heavy-metal-associated domain-containing protein [Bacteroidetes bacterium]|nr:heavy-metal-associated domain-containing protein [Bacteroidota bacterium]